MSYQTMFLIGLLVVVLLATSVLKVRMRKPKGATQAGIREVDDRVTPEQLAEADKRLERLPQFLRLPDGELLDLFSGAIVALCDCKLAPAGHRQVIYAKGCSIGILRQQSMAKYVAAHEAFGRLLEQVGFPSHGDAAGSAQGSGEVSHG